MENQLGTNELHDNENASLLLPRRTDPLMCPSISPIPGSLRDWGPSIPPILALYGTGVDRPSLLFQASVPH